MAGLLLSVGQFIACGLFDNRFDLARLEFASAASGAKRVSLQRRRLRAIENELLPKGHNWAAPLPNCMKETCWS